MAVVTSAVEVGNTRPSATIPETVARIHEVAFYSLTTSLWDDIDVSGNADSSDRESYNNPQAYEHPCASLIKILSSGSFYYAVESQWDLSSRLSRRLAQQSSDSNDYYWNLYIARSLIEFRDRLDTHEQSDFDECQFTVCPISHRILHLLIVVQILAIQGYVGVSSMALPAPPTNGAPTIATLSLISRLGWKRAGTRFNTRGVDDDGNCANFVEVSP